MPFIGKVLWRRGEARMARNHGVAAFSDEWQWIEAKKEGDRGAHASGWWWRS